MIATRAKMIAMTTIISIWKLPSSCLISQTGLAVIKWSLPKVIWLDIFKYVVSSSFSLINARLYTFSSVSNSEHWLSSFRNLLFLMILCFAGWHFIFSQASFISSAVLILCLGPIRTSPSSVRYFLQNSKFIYSVYILSTSDEKQ